MNGPLWPLLIYFILTVALAAAMIIISWLLGERHKERATTEPYESGITSTGSARLHFSVKFYLVAMFFVIFDVESIYIFAWAISINEAGWKGYLAIVIFAAVMVAALVYLWRCGGLDWSEASLKKEKRK
jgi:NADH-quinone oxidoreductase subunit A